MPSSFTYRDRTAIVSGGAGDIGSTIVRKLHTEGMQVVIADLDPVRIKILTEELGDRVLGVAGDLTLESEAKRLLEKTQQTFGGCDVLINNMAMTSTDRFHERSVDSIKREIDVVMLGPMILTRLAVPYLQKSQDPRVITMSSLGGITPLRETPIYTTAKFGLRGAMLSFALDEPLHGIKVSCVLPTATDTFMLRQEALEGGSVLNFIDDPQPISAVLDQVIRQLETPKLERYPKTSDSLLARFAMLFPNILPRFLPLFEKKGRRGLKRYLADLHKRGLIEEVDGKLRQKARQHLRNTTAKKS
ncbi:MAG: SDR family oxidoreductase [Verrucomicrobiales bacterium]|nr:SDR family NAD(P)-dependent oxidoreductase [Verrucomicrobiaceae bacterium]